MQRHVHVPAILRVMLALAAGNSAGASDVSLTAVQFPEKTSIGVTFLRTAAAPGRARADASVRFADGQARIRITFKAMEPAILFGGDVSSYVVWAVTRDGVAENLGELVVDESDDSGSGDYATGKKLFALMVTAEPYSLVAKPDSLVVFTSLGVAPDKAESTDFAFNAFGPSPKHDVESIAALTDHDKTPVVVRQARRALSLAEASGADAVNAQAMRDAKTAYGQALNIVKAGGGTRALTDYSRKTIGLVAEALRDVARKAEADAAAAEAARRKAELDALAGKASSAEAARAETEATLAQVDAARQALAVEKAQLEKDKAQALRDKAAIQADRDALAKRLVGSMNMIMETRESARGVVMSLPGISFDAARATLRTAAKITLAKLAGLLLVFPNVNMKIEGYTDSTGNAAANLKLSEARAKSVTDFLEELGVPHARLAYEGLGASHPVADNATAEGRAKNRRVEIVAAEGQIKAVPAE